MLNKTFKYKWKESFFIPFPFLGVQFPPKSSLKSQLSFLGYAVTGTKF